VTLQPSVALKSIDLVDVGGAGWIAVAAIVVAVASALIAGVSLFFSFRADRRAARAEARGRQGRPIVIPDGISGDGASEPFHCNLEVGDVQALEEGVGVQAGAVPVEHGDAREVAAAAAADVHFGPRRRRRCVRAATRRSRHWGAQPCWTLGAVRLDGPPPSSLNTAAGLRSILLRDSAARAICVSRWRPVPSAFIA
jgi:hypothetical protein